MLMLDLGSVGLISGEKNTPFGEKNPFPIVKCILHFYSRVTVNIEWVSLEIMQQTNGLY